jgi:hypothetical protein
MPNADFLVTVSLDLRSLNASSVRWWSKSEAASEIPAHPFLAGYWLWCTHLFSSSCPSSNPELNYTYSWSRDSLSLIESKGSFLCTQEPTFCQYSFFRSCTCWRRLPFFCASVGTDFYIIWCIILTTKIAQQVIWKLKLWEELVTHTFFQMLQSVRWS